MGNSVVTANITLDHETPGTASGRIWAARAGETLTGKLSIRVTSPIKGEKVELTVIGKERVMVRGGSFTRQILAMSALLEEFGGRTVARGQYIYPFAFDLPSSLPSATSYAPNATTPKWRIEYKVIAKIVGNTANKKLNKQKDLMLASAPFLDVLVPCFVQPKTEPIKSRIGTSLGSVTFGASVQDTQIGRGESLKIAIACKNNSDVEIVKVSIKLMELLGYGTPETAKMETKITLADIQNVDHPGLDRKKAKSKDKEGPYSTVDQEELNYGEIYAQLQSKRDIVEFKIPEHARDTYVGKLIQVQHYLKIKLDTPYFAENLSLKIPLFIGYAPERNQEESRMLGVAAELSDQSTPHLPPPPGQQQTGRPISSRMPLRQRSRPVLVDVPMDYENIPIVAADLIPLAPPVQSPVASASAVVVGGGELRRSNLAQASMELRIPEILSPVPVLQGSIEQLLEVMFGSINDLDLVLERIENDAWQQVFRSLTPSEFGLVIAHVNLEVDQPRVAALIAPKVERFSCAHCTKAMESTADWNCPSLVQAVLPHCFDLDQNKGLILSRMSPWERTVTAGDFERALRSA